MIDNPSAPSTPFFNVSAHLARHPPLPSLDIADQVRSKMLQKNYNQPIPFNPNTGAKNPEIFMGAINALQNP